MSQDEVCVDYNCEFSPDCPRCRTSVFYTDTVLLGNEVWHRQCFVCCDCGTQLVPGNCLETGVLGILICFHCDSNCKDGSQDCGSDQRPLGHPHHSHRCPYIGEKSKPFICHTRNLSDDVSKSDQQIDWLTRQPLNEFPPVSRDCFKAVCPSSDPIRVEQWEKCHQFECNVVCKNSSCKSTCRWTRSSKDCCDSICSHCKQDIYASDTVRSVDHSSHRKCIRCAKCAKNVEK